MNLQKIDIHSIPKAAQDFVGADVRRFLDKDCEYYYDERHEMFIERHPDGELFRLNFVLTCEREKTIRINPAKLKSDEATERTD